MQIQPSPIAPGPQTAVANDAQSQMREFALALQSARTRRQLSVEAAAKACLLSDNQIRGLEAADLRAFYSAAYARRGAERYAKFLGVSPVPQAFMPRFNAPSPDYPGRPAPGAWRPNHWASRLKDWIDQSKLQRRRASTQTD
jgi:hypothetical protein